jgi:PRC-barrel domain
MLRSLNRIMGSSIVAEDGTIGKVCNILFVDTHSRVAYLVVDVGGWFRRRQVLLSPAALGQPDWREKTIPVSLTREQVRNSPDVDTDQPVSRQNEVAMSKYYGWPLWNNDLPSTPVTVESLNEDVAGDSHLRSARELLGYQVLSGTDELGQVEDLYLDDENWTIRYAQVNSGFHLGGHTLLLPLDGGPEISWTYRRVQLMPVKA